MLTGDLLRVRTSKDRVIPLYLNRDSPQWLEAAESLLAIFRAGVGMTRGEIEEEIDDLFGSGGKATLVHRGIAKVLEDRAEFEVVSDVPPELIREKVFTAAAEARRKLRDLQAPREGYAKPGLALRSVADPGGLFRPEGLDRVNMRGAPRRNPGGGKRRKYEQPSKSEH